jgi:hypothetical protein
VARPLRNQYPIARYARRRHRTWMVSMTLATLAMGVWGIEVVWLKLHPESAPNLSSAFLVASLFAVPGFVLGVLTLRARLAWLVFAIVPLFANGMLLFLPWIMLRMRDSG